MTVFSFMQCYNYPKEVVKASIFTMEDGGRKKYDHYYIFIVELEAYMKLEKNGDILIVRPEGELDHHYAARLRQAVDGAIMVGDIRRVVFDFTGVGFMDSSGIGVLMGRYRLMSAVGGSVSAFGVSPRLDKLITMSGIKKIINIYETEYQATASQTTRGAS